MKKQTRVIEDQASEVVVAKDNGDIDKTEAHEVERTDSADGGSARQLHIDDSTYSTQEKKETMLEENIKPPPISLEEFYGVFNAGDIDLAFPEYLEYETSPECYPRSYFTLSGKERLLLLFAENFRKQFHTVYPGRRPLVLVVKNECRVQKLVCTTIRPTAFLYPPLIANMEGCANFVADFIEYKALENPAALPPTLVSPATLLRRRQGNSFELATLLCSMLIGAGFPAMVVSGSARLETVQNDQRSVDYPLNEEDNPSAAINEESSDCISIASEAGQRYRLRPKPDLESHLTERITQMKLKSQAEEKCRQEEEARLAQETLEDEVLFNDTYRLSHAWVAVVNNAPWSTKPRVKMIDEDGEEIDAPPSVIFIEPSTGFVHESFTKAYIHIESVWNNLNYYINLQTCRIREMKWDLRDTSAWEHLLPGEPPEMQIAEELSDDNLFDNQKHMSIEKHLDMTISWVQKLYIGEKEFHERFPNQHKAIYYRRVLHERFSPHSQQDGKILQVTLFADDGYEIPQVRWDSYDNRSDLLTKVKFDFSTGQTEEYFLKGRPESLRYFIHNNDNEKVKFMHFYSTPRLDSLLYCEMHAKKLVLRFEKFPGKCFHKEFITNVDMTKLREITEKFQRNPEIPAEKDIAVRRFLLAENKIHLKFHYAHGALTAPTREFIKPPKPDYGQEIIYNPTLTNGIKFGGTGPDATELELYLLLLEQLKAEDRAKKAFYKHIEELHGIVDLRKREMRHTELKLKCFDPLRNSAARKIRLEKDALEAQIKIERRANLPDYLAPYLVSYSGRTLTQKESWMAYNACLNDLKSRSVSLLNELQRRYEDLTAEALSLKKFLNKFHEKFDDFDHQRLLKESKDLELNKRMVQKRLTITHEEAQRKYDLVKQSLLNDRRLNLRSTVSEGDL